MVACDLQRTERDRRKVEACGKGAAESTEISEARGSAQRAAERKLKTFTKTTIVKEKSLMKDKPIAESLVARKE